MIGSGNTVQDITTTEAPKVEVKSEAELPSALKRIFAKIKTDLASLEQEEKEAA